MDSVRHRYPLVPPVTPSVTSSCKAGNNSSLDATFSKKFNILIKRLFTDNSILAQPKITQKTTITV